MNERIKSIRSKIKKFCQDYEVKIVLILGFILVAVISFEFGLIQGKKGQDKPLIIEKTVASQNIDAQAASASTPQAQNSAPDAKITPTSNNIPPSNCTFVGSKNSNKYHLPTCRFAKLIKPANLVCFASVQDAVAKGYQPDKGCVK